MSQEWFYANRPFYLVQVFYRSSSLDKSKLRQYLYEDRITVGSTIRCMHPDCEVTIICFSEPHIVDELNGKLVWRGRAGDFERIEVPEDAPFG